MMNDNKKANIPYEPLTEDDIVMLLSRLCDKECEYTPTDCNIEDFAPLKIFNALTDNPDYDPDNFSQEIEDSEEDKRHELFEFKLKHYNFAWGWDSKNSKEDFERLQNSEEWYKNHSKKCPTKLDLNIVGICQCGTKTAVATIKDGEQVITVTKAKWRDYNNDFNKEKLFDYLKKKREEGINVYKIV